MTQLGHGGVYRIGAAVAGWLAPPKDSNGPPSEEPCVIGHRGAPCEAAENTVRSFQTALDRGADSIETDVCVTKDREIVLWHDADPNEKLSLVRQVGGEKLRVVPDVPGVGSGWRKPVRELELARMREHFAYRVRREEEGDGNRGERIPFETLPDLFRWLETPAERSGAPEGASGGRPLSPRRVYLDIKLEGDQTEDALLLLRAVRDFCGSGESSNGASFHLMSVHREIVATLLGAARTDPLPDRAHVYADFERPGVLEFARRLGARRVGIGRRSRAWGDYRRELKRVLAESRARRIDSVVAWTVNDEEELRTLLRMGVRAVMTDEIPRLRRLMPREGAS